DAVFINTGWGDLFRQYPAQNETFRKGEPGIGAAAGEWLAAQKVGAVGADTPGGEGIPMENPDVFIPVHKTLITDNGVQLIENVRTDLIAAEAASRDGRPFS